MRGRDTIDLVGGDMLMQVSYCHCAQVIVIVVVIVNDNLSLSLSLEGNDSLVGQIKISCTAAEETNQQTFAAVSTLLTHLYNTLINVLLCPKI